MKIKENEVVDEQKLSELTKEYDVIFTNKIPNFTEKEIKNYIQKMT